MNLNKLRSSEVNIFFTSDTHAYHKNIVKGVSSWSDIQTCRNFENQIDMTEELIKNINAVVKEDDILFHLGDWSFGGIDKVWEFRKQINCKNIHLILGNHDHHIENNQVLPNIFDKIHYEDRFYHTYLSMKDLFKSVSHYQEINIDGVKFVLMHYAMRVWNKSHHGSIHLYGHSHGNIDNNYGLSMDVGVDTNDLKPYSYKKIIEIMDTRQKLLIDHHNENTH